MIDEERVHVVVTVEMAEEPNEGHDVATDLPEIRRALSSLYNLRFSLTSP